MTYWQGEVGPKDDFGLEIEDVFYDGRTAMGPWAIMVRRSFVKYGCGLGTGRGQKYERQEDGKWLKVEG